MDYFRRMLAHFGWTWLERVHRRRKDRTPTALARVHAKRCVAEEIEAGIEDYELSRVQWVDFCEEDEDYFCEEDEDWQWWCEFQAQRTIDEFRWN